MTFNTTPTREINDNIIAQIQTTLNQTIPPLPKSFNRVLAKTLAGVLVTLNKYAGFMFLQMFVRTATFDETVVNGQTIRPLVEWGRLIGIGDPTPATQAELRLNITVVSQGGTLPTGTQFIGQNGVTYISLDAVALDAATVGVDVRASGDPTGGDGSGVIGNLAVGATISFATSVPGVQTTAAVGAVTVVGADAETEENYRTRVQDRFRRRPQGGAYADYELWGEEVPGIINIYPYTGTPGEVNIYAEADTASSNSVDGIPTGPQLLAVQNAIRFDSSGRATRQPGNTFVNVLPIQRIVFNIDVVGLNTPNTGFVRSTIENSARQLFADAEPFIPGLTLPPRQDFVTRSQLIALVQEIVAADNGTFGTVRFSQDGVGGSIERYNLGEGVKIRLNEVTYPNV